MEDYKEKYEKLHRFVNDLYPHMSDYCKEKVEGYFPELKESEDERVRKEIKIVLANTDLSQFALDHTFADMLAWLEKPKYTKEDLDKAYKCADEVQYRHGYEDAKKEIEKQGEQKSAWSEEDEDMIDLLVNILEINHPDEYFKANQKDEVGIIAVPTKKIISWLKSLKERMKGK